MATTARKRNLCNVCGKRTVGSGGRQYDTQSAASLGMCGPCDSEGGWENTHSDWGHEEILAKPEAERTAEDLENIDGCWICFPELNMAQKEHKPRTSKGSTGTRKVTSRRPQLNHRTQCLHPQTPEARRECRKAFWAAEAAKAEQASKGSKGKRSK